MSKQIESLSTRLSELRPSAMVSVSRRFALSPIEALDSFVVSLGFRAIGNCWRAISKDQATKLLTYVLEYDLAFQSSVEMEHSHADLLANEFMNMAGQASYFTNGSFVDGGWSGHKVAPGTFETGVAWVGAEVVGILWVQDED